MLVITLLTKLNKKQEKKFYNKRLFEGWKSEILFNNNKANKK